MLLGVSEDMSSLNKHCKTMLVVNNFGGVYTLGKGFILASILIFGNTLLMAPMFTYVAGLELRLFGASPPKRKQLQFGDLSRPGLCGTDEGWRCFVALRAGK